MPLVSTAAFRADAFGTRSHRCIGMDRSDLAGGLIGRSVALAATNLPLPAAPEERRAGRGSSRTGSNGWAVRIGLRRAAELSWVPGPISPMIWFVGARPRLIIPQELWKRLDARQRSTLIVHELAHLRRGDHLVRLLELLVTALFWWHPLVWWMRVPLREAEEQCCDAWVVWALPDAVRAYAETLLDTLEFLQTSESPGPAAGQRPRQGPSSSKEIDDDHDRFFATVAGAPRKAGLVARRRYHAPGRRSSAQKAKSRRTPGLWLPTTGLELIDLPDVDPGRGQFSKTRFVPIHKSPRIKRLSWSPSMGRSRCGRKC